MTVSTTATEQWHTPATTRRTTGRERNYDDHDPFSSSALPTFQSLLHRACAGIFAARVPSIGQLFALCSTHAEGLGRVVCLLALLLWTVYRDWAN